MSATPRPLVLSIAIGSVLGVLAPVSAAAAAPDESISGFTPDRSAKQRRAEARFQRAVSAAEAGKTSRNLNERPHLI
jgi:hypothetical protein